MREIYKLPEQGLSPEYWDGHSLEDDCRWGEWPKLEKGTDLGALRREYSEASRVGQMILEAYKDLPLPFPIKTFREDETFDASQFPPGTLLRVEDEQMHPHDILAPKGMPHYWRRTHLGIVYPCDKDPRAINKRMVVHVAEGVFKRGGRAYFSSSSSWGNINIDEVSHERTVYGGLANRWGRSHDQSIRRVNKVEILKYGEGVAVLAEQTQERLVFSPHTS